MEKNNKVTLAQILDFITSIEKYIHEKSFIDFENDELLQDGVLSPQFKTSHPEIPFREASDTRNKLIHEYDDVDLKIVWDTIIHDLPVLKASLMRSQ